MGCKYHVPNVQATLVVSPVAALADSFSPAVHNLEEALSLPRFLPLDPDFIYSALRPLLAEMTYAQFLMVLVSVMVLPFLIAECDDLHRSGKGGIFLLLGYQAVVLLNVFSHIASALILGGYQLCAALARPYPSSVSAA